VDLGKWFSEEHVISEPLRPEHFADPDAPPSEDRPDRPVGKDS
jgi:endogenous inhibitor of DNA gyrase (YacG/DUF329 family)